MVSRSIVSVCWASRQFLPPPDACVGCDLKGDKVLRNECNEGRHVLRKQLPWWPFASV